MFYFFVDPACHAKSALRNSELADTETSRKHQNISGNIYGFYLYFTFLYIWNKFDYNEVVVTILAQQNLLALKHCIYAKQDQFIYFLPVPCMGGGVTLKVKGLDYLVSKDVPSWLSPTNVENFLKLDPLDWLKLTPNSEIYHSKAFIKQEFVAKKKRICNVIKM